MKDLKLLIISFLICFVYYLPFGLLTFRMPTVHERITFNEQMETNEKDWLDCTIKDASYSYSRGHKGRTISNIVAEVVNNKNKEIKFIKLGRDGDGLEAKNLIGKRCYLKAVVNSPHLEYSLCVVLKEN